MSDRIRPRTRLVHAGRRKEWTRGLVNPPVSRASTLLFDDIAGLRASYPPSDGKLTYGRYGTETHWALCDALTALEPGAAGTRLFPSGLNAVTMALLSVLKPGDELLCVDSVYDPTRRFCDQVLAPQDIVTRYYDPLASAEELEALVSGKTHAIFLESPGSNSFEVQDVRGICAMAKRRGLVTLLDNTWATPLFFPAIAAGVDLSILACTKYVVGHADAMLGSVTATAERWEALCKTSMLYGIAVGADDAWLALRGLRTLEARLRQHEAGAIEVARWLSQQPKVERVIHPALQGAPGHEFWKRDFSGASGLFAFALKDSSDAKRNAFIECLQLFGIGFSWGGYESLALPSDPKRSVAAAPGPLVRLHIGLEDPRDLIDDLAQALAAHG